MPHVFAGNHALIMQLGTLQALLFARTHLRITRDDTGKCLCLSGSIISSGIILRSMPCDLPGIFLSLPSLARVMLYYLLGMIC